MILSIATEGNMVCPHFGHAPFFTLVDIVEGKVVSNNKLQSPGHSPGALPAWMKGHNVELVICGGMGPKAKDLFTQFGIGTITVEPAEIDKIIQDYIDGKLTEGPSACNHG